jgi:hypothetical protein
MASYTSNEGLLLVPPITNDTDYVNFLQMSLPAARDSERDNRHKPRPSYLRRLDRLPQSNRLRCAHSQRRNAPL